MLDAALDYTSRGWPVLPVHWDGSKRPLTPHGFKDASTDQGLTRARWTQWPQAWIGVPTGARYFVADVDDLNAIARLETEYGSLPDTRRASTRRGGIHFWLAGAAQTGRNVPVPGIDIRGYAGRPGKPGGFVVVPPSPGYAWHGPRTLAKAPAWLVELLRRRHTLTQGSHGVERWIESVRYGFEDGQVSGGDGRKLGLCRLVGHLLGKGVDARLVRELAHLLNTRNRPPLPASDVDRVCDWVWRREIAKLGGER
jgi:hypothetical protein